ncbi:MAG: hypothetical protein AAF604_18095 [Acidobacteriota bacterium]
MSFRLPVASCCLVLLSVVACGPPAGDQEEPEVDLEVCTDPTSLDLACSALPDVPAAPQQPDYDYFSWNSFIALNWPAVDPSAGNSYARGFPDSSASFTDTTAGDLDSLVVWETFKEKREIFDFGPGPLPTPNPQPPGQWRQAVSYFGNVGGDIVDCPGAGGADGSEVLFQSSKSLPDSLDETLEVLSEARESTAQLCGGYTTGPKAQTCQQVAGHAVSPHVWKGLPTDANPQPIRYEVKVNWDFFNYVAFGSETTTTATYTDLYKDSVKQAAMQDPEAPLRLPYRSNSSTRPNGQPETPRKPNKYAVLDYSALDCMQQNMNGPTDPTLNPCASGAVHTKSAWIPLYDESDYSRYYTKKALYYVFNSDTQKVQCQESIFGLVGFHIIQRIHQSSGQKGVGGTFIFSSWEHKELQEGGYNYVVYWDGRPLDAPNSAGFYPNPQVPTAVLPVKRQVNTVLPNTQQVNEDVWSAIAARNPNSPWLNYRLIGTQFLPVDLNAVTPPTSPKFPVSTNDPLGIGQPQFMANLALETSLGLQDFKGLAALTVVNGNFLGTEPVKCPVPLVGNKCPKKIVSNTSAGFARDDYNLAFGTLTESGDIDARAYNMGGCMGCHGVAQLRGSTFSFVLLAGQAGADADTEQTFTEQPPPSVP